MNARFFTKTFLFATGLMIFSYVAKAQSPYDRISSRIDSLANIGLPKSALKEVETLGSLARKNNNAPQQIKASIYRMTFQSYLEENALEAIIDRLKLDINRAAYPVKPVLQSLLGEMYWNYYQQNRYRFAQRTKEEDTDDDDFTEWDLRTIINETSRLYQYSLADASKEQNTDISVLDGVLEGDSSTRYLRPTLYDFLVQRAFDFFLTDEPALPQPRLPFSLDNPAFFSDSRTFSNLAVKPADTTSTEYRGILYLQQATRFHLLRGDKEALADLDLQRLKFLYDRSKASNKDMLYIAALDALAKAVDSKPICADVWVAEGQYYQQKDSLILAHSLFERAAKAWPKSIGGENGASLLRQMELPELSGHVEDLNIPGQPVLTLLSYKNTNAAYIEIYRLSYTAFENFIYSQNQPKALQQLKKLRPVRTGKIGWDTVEDYKTHTLEFKIDPLDAGNYVVLFTGAGKRDSIAEAANFRVSKIAVVSRETPDGSVGILVTARQTGQPLKGVKVELAGKHYTDKGAYSETDTTVYGVTNDDGLFSQSKIMAYSLYLRLIAGKDTLTDERFYTQGAEYDYDEDPENKTVLFTDRQIYRPGQTLYFKALELQNFKGKSKILTNKSLTVQLKDANGKQVSSLSLKTNEYGTAAGNFIIPQSVLGGYFTLGADDGSINFRVEEYKRPSFQVEFEPVTGSYKLDDSVKLTGQVTAFSGYGISQARIAYHITRTRSYILYPNNPNSRHIVRRFNGPEYNEAEIGSDTIVADNQGRFHITFKAAPGDADRLDKPQFNFKITADVTDESGETHSGAADVNIADDDLKITGDIPNRLTANSNDTVLVTLGLENLNGQQLKGKMKLVAWALKDPGEVFKDRLWDVPDKELESKDEFAGDFPGYAYGTDGKPENWPLGKMVFADDQITDTVQGARFGLATLAKQPSGIYRIVLSAKNEKGDSVSRTAYVKVINKMPKPLLFSDWEIPEKNTVKTGDTATFFVGINHRINVRMERYNGPNLISSSWLVIDTGVKRIKVPIADTDKNPAVQFTMVYQNRAYSAYERIHIYQPSKEISLKFLTFRDKLQPGQREQWKLQLTLPANRKPDAELLAAMYDAALDKIDEPQYWDRDFDPRNGYMPNFFAWNTWSFVQERVATPLINPISDFGLIGRDYETLSLLGYDYFGGYNANYQEYLRRVAENANANNGKPVGKGGRVLTGVVLGADDNQPVIGASVVVKGSGKGAVTDARGRFTIRVPAGGTLIFSYVGYNSMAVSRFLTGDIVIKLSPNNSTLREVVVTGYQTQLKKGTRQLTYATATVDNKSLTQPGMFNTANGLEGKVSGVQVTTQNLPEDVLKKINLRGKDFMPPKPITPRTNFNETAFFYPQLHTDEKGQVLIDFTIPEALTRWKFRGLAHTRELQTGYIEAEVVTQKQLSISANTPRFLREGDTITISARLANLTAGKLKGKVQLQLFNAINMQPVNLFINKADAAQDFSVDGNTNKAVSFKLAIPAGLDALDYRLTADAGDFTDGEENTLPVLPNRMLVTESMPMMVRAGQTKDFTFDKLVNQHSSTLKNKTLTLEYTSQPAWYAVQALPYMMEYPYECSEQTFSRYFANSLATDIVNKNPAIKKIFELWKQTNSTELLSNLEKNQELKATLIEETPWLRDAESETEQKKRIALLFDLNKMSDELKLTLDKLQKRQLPNGGFNWFGGDYADRYITQYIVEGMGELHHLHMGDTVSELQQMAGRAIDYLDGELLMDEKERKKLKDGEWSYGDLEIQAWFARSFYTDRRISPALRTALDNYLKWAETNWTLHNAYEEGMIALSMQRYGKTDVTAKIERSLLETAQQSDDLGMYWAKNQLGYYWYESPVETQSLLIELFTEAGDNAKAVDEMKIWLLRNKQTNDWKTTKATASACYALLLKSSNLLADTGATSIKLGGKPLEELKPDVKADAGTGYLKTSWQDEQIKPELGKVEIKNTGKTLSWGALHWQYLENLDKITSANTNIHLRRKYFVQKQTDAGAVLTEVDATHQPKVGDLLKVVVYLDADRDFEYVQLKDMRPAGTEPVDALSTYKYQDGLYYYQVTKDVATNFFISELPKGSFVFEYRLRVAQPGNFSTGVTGVQCMYAPEFNAHSEGGRMAVKP